MSIYAPYNFVPLSAWIFKPDWAHQVSHDLPFSDGISGTLELEIKAHTPILVGGQQKKSTEGSGKVHFFQSPDKRYAIPGTSLKGMIRNVLEIASFGKMRLVDEHQWLSVRDLTTGGEFYRQHLSQPLGQNTYRPLARAGWLKLVTIESTTAEGQKVKNIYWQITPCQYARVEQADLIKWGKTQGIKNPEQIIEKQTSVNKYKLFQSALNVNFDLEGKKRWAHGPTHRPLLLEYAKAQPTLGHGTLQGQLVFTGQPAKNTGEKGRKHLEFIFYAPTANPQNVDETVIHAFQQIHADSEEWQHWYEKMRHDQSVPVFYLEKAGEIDSLGLAMMYRLPYQNSIGETIKHTNWEHLQDNFYDLPELLCGTVTEDKTEFTLKSRISFSLAYLQNQPEIQSIERLPLTILGSPKASYYPSYVQQNKSPQLSNGQSYMTYMDKTAEVRGWKRYPIPINPRWTVPKADPGLSHKVKVKLYPLAEGACFKCAVKIHNLRPQELGALIWALTWGSDPNLRHGLGMGKPFGLGQVSIQIKPDSWQKLRTNHPTGTVPSQAKCQQDFVDMMEQAWQNAEKTGPQKNAQVKWADSEQLKQLLAMANPEIAQGQVDQLAYMSLTEFQDNKNKCQVLPPYVNYQGPSDRDLFRRFTPIERWQFMEKQQQQAKVEKKTAEMSEQLAKFSSDLERQLHQDLFLAPNPSIAEAKAAEWLDKMEKRETEETQKIAKMLKQFYVGINKWKGGSKKQVVKVRRVKEILGE